MTKDEIREKEKEKVMVIAQSQAGPIENVPNLRKRQRAIYYCPVKKADGSIEWLATQPLPSDAQGRELYLSKGFRLSPPSDTAKPEQPIVDEEKEALLSEITDLRNQLKMAKAREAKGKT